MADDSRHIAGHQVKVPTQTQDQRGIPAHSHQLLRLVRAEDTQSVCSLHAVQRPGHGSQQVPPVIVVDQLGHHLGVGLRGEGHPLIHEKLLQPGVIFNDAVVYHGDAPGLAHLGMGIDVVGRAVGSPAGVAHPGGPGQRPAPLRQVRKHLQPPLCLGHLQTLFLVPYGYPRRVIPPVFQPGQTLQQDGRDLLRSNISNDSAHIPLLL